MLDLPPFPDEDEGREPAKTRSRETGNPSDSSAAEPSPQLQSQILTPHIYPLSFEPVYKDYIWGGRNLGTKLGRKIRQASWPKAGK